MKYEIDGVYYYAAEMGEGFPLIMLHGFTGDSSAWKPFYAQWSEQRKLIAIDIIGHGKSDSPSRIERYDMLSVAQDIKTILEQFQIEKADIVGYSMGGRLALSFAVQYPGLVRKLVLESSSPGLELEMERENRRRHDEKLGRFILEQGMEKFVDYWENIPLFSTQKGLPLEKQNKLRKQRLQNSARGLSNSLIGMGTGSQPSWWQQLHRIQADTLLLTGSLDKKFCLIAEKMSNEIQHSAWINVVGCGHTIHVENPEKFGTIVNRFLSNSSF